MDIKRHTVFILREYVPDTIHELFYQTISDKLDDILNIDFTVYKTGVDINSAIDRRPDFIVCKDFDHSTLKPNYYNFITVLFDKNIDISKLPPGTSYMFNDDILRSISDIVIWKSTILPHRDNWIVIGDLHACIDELYILLKEWGCIIINDTVIIPDGFGILFIGDLIDKGIKTKETIDFLWKNRKIFHFVRGNHDEFVYKYLKSGGESSSDLYAIEHHDSILFFNNNKVTRERFYELYKELRTYAECDAFIATHSPCYYYELGMLNPLALAFQRKMKLNMDIPLWKQMQCIEENTVKGKKYHVFGHIPFKPLYFKGNEIGIDTGCIHGHALGSVCIDTKSRAVEFRIQPFLGIQPLYPEEIVKGCISG